MRGLARVVAALVGLLPWASLSLLGRAIAVLAFDVLRIRRAHVVASLARAGLDTSRAREIYVSLGVGLFELLWMSARRGAPLEGRVRFEGLDRFERARARGRGVIVATAHTGNWDLAACAAASIVPLSVVTKRLSSRGLDAFWQETRRARGVHLLAAPDGQVLSKARARLASGGAVALMIDQDPERATSVVAAPFLGEIALHDVLPAALAARTGAPLVLVLGRREGRDHVVEVVDVYEGRGRAFAIEATRAMAARLDAFVRRHPSQWLWLHRRWKSAVTSDARVPCAIDAAAADRS